MTVFDPDVIKLTIISVIIAFLLAMTNTQYYQWEISAQLTEQPQVNANTTQSSTSPMVSPSLNYSSCSAPEGQPDNYFTLACQNTLVNTTDQIDSLQCDKKAGWIAVCVWRQQPREENGTSKIFAVNSLTGAANWATPQLLSDNSTNAFKPILGMAPEGEKVYVAFLQNAGNSSDVFLVQSNNGGLDWNLPATNISNNPSNVTELTLTVDVNNGGVTVAWISAEENSTTIEERCARC